MNPHKIDTCVIISAGAEWHALLPHFPGVQVHSTPYGEAFITLLGGKNVVFLHGGWGKVAAAGGTQ